MMIFRSRAVLFAFAIVIALAAAAPAQPFVHPGGRPAQADLGAADALILETKDALLERICRADYLDSSEIGRGVLKSAYGNKVAYSSWGDYFLMEALDRELNQGETFW